MKKARAEGCREVCEKIVLLGMKSYLMLLGLAAFVIISCPNFSRAAVASRSNEPRLAFVDRDKLSVCISVFQPFGYGQASDPNGRATFEAEPYTNGGQDADVMSEVRLKLIKETGFDCIRLVVDVGPLLAAKDNLSLNRLIEQLAVGVERRILVGLKVIVDIHPLPVGAHRVSGWADTDLIDGVDGPKFNRLVSVVSVLARAIDLKFKPSQVALELFNEPPPYTAFYRRTDWNTQIEYYWRKIRDVLPHHTIIVSGMGFAAIDGVMTGDSRSGMINLRPENYDANTAYAFHPYESPTFTAQASPGFYSHVHGLTFPADQHPGGQKKAEQDFIQIVNADSFLSSSQKKDLVEAFVRRADHPYSFARYWKEFGNSQALARRHQVAMAWADKNRLNRRQIFNTEFGVSRSQASCPDAALASSAARFIRAIRDISVAQGMGLITIHELQGDCFGISSGRVPFAFDPSVTKALNLK